MDVQEAKAVLESLLFVADEPVTVARLASALEVDRSLIKQAAQALSEVTRQRADVGALAARDLADDMGTLPAQ